MTDFVLIRKSRNILSSVLHVILNILLAVGSICITLLTGDPIIGLVLVLLSKWRMFAVRWRYLPLNLKSNSVDLIVGCSFVLIAYCAGTVFLPIHAILAVLYSVWLTVLKPRSSNVATEIQSVFALFFGTTALCLMAANADSIFFVLGGFVIGYSAVRHVLVQGENDDYGILLVGAGLITAEVCWLCHSWLIVYSFVNTGIMIPQLSLILSILAFACGYTYKSLSRNDGKLKWGEVGMPIAFSVLLVMFIVIWFSQPIFNV